MGAGFCAAGYSGTGGGPSRSESDRQGGLTNNAVERQERLGRVRADLLGPKELDGGLMRSQTQEIPMPVVPPAILNAGVGGGAGGNSGGIVGLLVAETLIVGC